MNNHTQKSVSTEPPMSNLPNFNNLTNLSNLSPIASNSPGSVSHSNSHSNSSSNSVENSLPNSVPNTASNSNSTPTPTQPIPKKSQQIKTDKPRPHSCSICTRAFARLEHLKRHERSHTNEKPFQCAACGRCFARRDLVLRHQQKLHTNLPNIMRRNSKGTESVPNLNNEHIIVLRNNTSANAPLPNGSKEIDDLKEFKDSGNPVFNTEVFSERNRSNSSVGTPHGSTPNPKDSESGINYNNPKKLFPRHSSYSAATSTSYTTLKDSNFNVISEESNANNVEFSTPQYNQNFDLNFDWNNMDALDLNNNNTGHNNDHLQNPHNPASNYDLDLQYNQVNQLKKRKVDDMSPSQTTPSYATPNSNAPNSKLRTNSFDSSLMNQNHRNSSRFEDQNFDPLNEMNLNANTGPGSAPASHQTPSHNTPSYYTPSHNTPGIHGPPSVSSNPSAPPSHHPSISNQPHQQFSQSQPQAHGHSRSFNQPKMRHSVGATSNHGSISGPSGHASNQAANQSPGHFNHAHHLSNTPSIPSVNSNPVSGHIIADRESISENGDWLQEIINTPYEPNFNQFDDTNLAFSGGMGSHNDHMSDHNDQINGFDVNLTNHPGNEITTLFRTRQSDLSKNMQMDLNSNPLPPPLPEPSSVIKEAAKVGNENIDSRQDNNEGHHNQLNNFEGQENLNHNLDMNLPLDKREFEFNDMSLFDHGSNEERNHNTSATNGASSTAGGFITEELRDRVIMISNLSEVQFPSLDDLNNYMKLYEKEFNKYFPFIHLPSLKNPMVDNFENIPLLLSMASIGALYSYHDSNTLLLFNLSKFHIQNFFEKEVTLDNLQFKKVPLMAHQCLVLHIFISMFLNEPPMIDITSRQMKSMVGLIKSTNFHKPLENFLVPPSSIANVNDQISVQYNFDYFIMTQSRIRTIFVFYMLQQFRTSTLLELSILLNISNINNGSYCINESLWKCENSEQWVAELLRLDILKDNNKTGSEEENKKNFSIIGLSNSDNINDLIKDLDVNNHETNSSEIKHPLNLNNLLMLLIYIHERIQQQFEAQKNQVNPHSKNDYKSFDYVNWRLTSENLKELIRDWEFKFIKNDGVLIIRDSNNYLLNENHELKLILPLYHFAKIKISVNLTPIIERIVHKDWENMNNYLNLLHLDFDGLKNSINHCLDIMNLWIQNIKVVNNFKENSLRTPVFFVTCVFASLLLISQFLYYIEQINDKDHGIYLGITEKTLWLKCEETLKNCEKILSLNYHAEQDQKADKKNNKSEGESKAKVEGQNQKKRKDQNKSEDSGYHQGHFNPHTSGGLKPLNGIEDIEYENYESIRKLIKNNSNAKLIVNSLKLIKLSNKCLFLGVRILADAPIWPLAMGFAEALKNRANYISKI